MMVVEPNGLERHEQADAASEGWWSRGELNP